MQAVRKIIDAETLTGLFSLPHLTSRQIDEIVEKSAVKYLVGVLKGTGLPENITMKDIREMRLKDRGGV
jgi:hypothetical protein